MVFRSRTPSLPPGAFDTWQVRPYWRRASCAEVDCDAHTHGWLTVLDVSTADGRDRADYIRHRSGRRFTAARTGPSRVTFRFPAAQTCFAAASHRVPAQRPELYVVRAGDWRRMSRTARTYDRPDQWVDDLRTATDRLVRARSSAGTGG